jgi:hypothetical protein
MGLLAPFFIYLIFINKTSMSVILLNKNKFRSLLKEAPVSGDQAALDIAKARGSLEKAKDRLQSIGVYKIPGLDSIKTIDQLSIEPFKFNFLLQVVDSDIEGLSLPKPRPVYTLARVIEKKPLTLELKTKEGVLFKMIFTKEEELITQLPGTKEPIIGKSNKVMALVTGSDDGKGKFYTIEFSNAKNVIEVIKKEKEEDKESEEGEGEDGKEVGESNKGGKGKEELFNDLAGFFKFTYNNRRLAAPNLFPKEKPKNTVESYINQIAKNTILIKEEEEEENVDPTKTKNLNGKIYIQSIVLGPKARTRAGLEMDEYTKKVAQSQQGQTKWDGNLKNLTNDPVEVSKVILKITDTSADPMAVKEVENQFNGNQYKDKATVRKSQNFSSNNTIVIGLKNNKAVVCKIPTGSFKLQDKINVEVSKKPMDNDTFGKPVKAELQIVL